MTATFEMNGQQVASLTLENVETLGTITHTFSGDKGTSAIVSFKINGVEVTGMEITF